MAEFRISSALYPDGILYDSNHFYVADQIVHCLAKPGNYLLIYEPGKNIFYKIGCAPSKDRSACASAQYDQSLQVAMWG